MPTKSIPLDTWVVVEPLTDNELKAISTHATQQEAELERQQGLGELQLQQQRTQQQQVQTQAKPTYSRSQEGIPEHLYELTQDYTIHWGDVRIRLRRGERYHGRSLVDHD